jgi:pimeloyl-ACP methyl ester carboxylesterase
MVAEGSSVRTLGSTTTARAADPHPVSAGAGLLVLGFVAVVVAAGAGFKHLVGGHPVVGVFSLVLAIGGIWAVVRGWRLVLSPIGRRWVRVLVAVLGTFLVAQFILLPAGMAVDATFRPRPVGSGVTPADRGLAYEDVRLTTRDGVDVAGWWVPGSAGGAVIVLPGAGSTREDVLDHVALLHAEGLGALAIDLRGHGESGGSRNEFGWGAERDVIAAVDHLRGRPEVTGGIGVLGLSMGGEVALTAAALDPRIDAVVADGASARTWADAQVLGQRHPVAVANAWLMFGLVDLLSPESPPPPLADAVTGIEARVLVIAAGDPTEVAAAARFREAAPERVAVWSVPDAPHIGALRVHPDAYREHVLAAFAGL